MSKSSVKETIAQAKVMGLELSSDGKSWVPIDEIVVKLHPDKHKQVRISANKKEGNSLWLQLMFQVGSVASLLIIIGSLITGWYLLKIFINFMHFIGIYGG